jgi:hypothetical protein
MFCKRRHYKNPTCFGHYSMNIFKGRPSFLVHLLFFSCLLRHLSFFGLWPYALYLYVCPVYLSVCCLVVLLIHCWILLDFFNVNYTTMHGSTNIKSKDG